MAKAPLAGIRVVDLTVGAAAPELCRVLAEFGAEVIKVESRENLDFMRRNGIRGVGDSNGSHGFNEANRNKKSITINMRSAKGRDLVRELIKKSDIVAENNRGDVVGHWGLDYASVREIKPDIIYFSSQGFGRGGPFEKYQAFGPNLAPYIGLTHLWSHPSDPFPVGGQINHPDHYAGKQGAIAVIAALEHRRRTGKGQHIQMSQAETAAAMMGEAYMEYTVNQRDPQPQGNRRSYAAPHNAYRCTGQDRWCVIAVFTEEEWRSFCNAIGSPEWTTDPKFATLLGRLQNVDELDAHVEEWTGVRSPYEVMETLQAAGVSAGVVQNAEDHLLHDPHMRHRGGVVELTHSDPEIGTRHYPSVPMRLSKTPTVPGKVAPLLGEHTDAVLSGLLGLDAAAIQQLRDDGVHIVEPGVGWLSCGVQGAGRMAEPDEILRRIDEFFPAT
ncbi:MAG: CoA transferase [Chloroflexi bacterium]|nr:CoA transferase [Chloroflexota bacterium]